MKKILTAVAVALAASVAIGASVVAAPTSTGSGPAHNKTVVIAGPGDEIDWP